MGAAEFLDERLDEEDGMATFAAFSTAYTPEPTRCSGGEKPGARVLQDWACDESPWAKDLWDVGIYNCRYIAGTSTLSAHSSGRAGDSGHNIVNGASHPSGIAYANWLVANHAILGIQEVISNRRRWDNQAKVWKSYGGVSPHTDHVHWTLNVSGALYLTRARLLSVAPGSPAPTQPLIAPMEDADMALVIRRIENPKQSVLIVPDKTSKIGVRGFYAEATSTAGNEGIIGADEVKVDKGAWDRIFNGWLAANGAVTKT